MTASNIPWHNPRNVESAGYSWRFLTKDEAGSIPNDAEYMGFSNTRWYKSNNRFAEPNFTYRTREPLPEKYRAQPAPSPEPEVEKSELDYFTKTNSPGLDGFSGVGTMANHSASGTVYGIIAPSKNDLDNALARLGLHHFEVDRAQELFISRLNPKPKAPPAPVMVEVPLEASDIPPVCWMGNGLSNSGALVTLVGQERIQFIGAQGHRDWTFQHLMDAKFQYSTDRINWQPCHKLVERKG